MFLFLAACGECKTSRKLSSNSFCKLDFSEFHNKLKLKYYAMSLFKYNFVRLVSAIKLVVRSRETVGDWLKFTAEVLDVYKQGRATVKRGRTQLWLARRDYTCRCPKLRLNRVYLFSSKDSSKSGDRPGFTINHRSRVTRWRDEMTGTMMRYSQTYRYGACPSQKQKTSNYRSARQYSSYY